MGIVNDNSMFIRMDTYKDAMTTIDTIKNKIVDAKKSLYRISELKKEEEVEMEIWKKMVHDVEERLRKIDHTMTNAGKR